MLILKSKESIGILFGIFAYLSFSILDTIQKTLIINHTVFQLLFVKYFFVFFLAFFEAKRKKIIYFINLKILNYRYLEAYYLCWSLGVLFYHLNIYL